jgi:drug/metabolite transporter (DMT)-like permease
MRRARLRARLELFGAAVVFGLMAVLARLGSREGGGGFGAAQLSAVRFAVGAGMTLALFRLRPGTWRPVNRRLLATRGLLGGLAVLFYFLALARIPAGEATLLNNTFPVLAVVLSFFTLGERPTAHLAAALLVTTLGVFLAVSGGTLGVLRLGLGWGELAGAISAVLGAGAVTSIRRLRATDNAPTIFFAFCVGGFVVALPFSLGDWPSDPRLWALAAAVGVLSFVAQLLMTDAYGALTVAEAAVWQQLTPIASFLWAMPLLGEPVTVATAVGVLVGAGGIVYGTVLGHKPAGAAEVPPPHRTTPTTEPVEPA